VLENVPRQQALEGMIHPALCRLMSLTLLFCKIPPCPLRKQVAPGPWTGLRSICFQACLEVCVFWYERGPISSAFLNFATFQYLQFVTWNHWTIYL